MLRTVFTQMEIILDREEGSGLGWTAADLLLRKVMAFVTHVKCVLSSRIRPGTEDNRQQLGSFAGASVNRYVDSRYLSSRGNTTNPPEVEKCVPSVVVPDTCHS